MRTVIHSYISITLSMHQEKWLLIRKPFNIFDILFHFLSDSTANHMHKIFVGYRPINIFVLLVVLFVMTSRQQYFSLQYDAQWLYFFFKNISDKLWLLAMLMQSDVFVTAASYVYTGAEKIFWFIIFIYDIVQ